MSVQTDVRAFLGTAGALSRDFVKRKWTGPIAAAQNLPQGSIAGALLTDANAMQPVIYAFVGDGTMRALGFVFKGQDNTSGAQGDGPPIDVLSCAGRMIDKNAGGAQAILQTDEYKPAYGTDNQTCSRLASDGPCVGMILGISPETGDPVILVDPFVATLMGGGNGMVLPGVASNVTAIKTAAYSAQFGDFVRCDPSGGAFPVNLPAIAAWNKGLTIAIKNVTGSATAITDTPNGAQTIDGAATLVQNVPREIVYLTSNGVSDWMVS